MFFIGVCVAECLNEPLSVGGFREKARAERAWLPLQFACSTSYTLSDRRKGPFNGPGMGRESPFHTWLVGNFSSILCMPFAYDPFFPQRSLRGRNPWNTHRIHQNFLSHRLSRSGVTCLRVFIFLMLIHQCRVSVLHQAEGFI